MFSLFKKVSTNEAHDYFADVWQRIVMVGLPDKKDRNSENYIVSPYNTLKKDVCVYTMRVKCGKWSLLYDSVYKRTEKHAYFTVWYMNLTISNPELQKQLREVFTDFTFAFMPSAIQVVSKKFPVKKIEDVKNAFLTFVSQWEKSGIFNILNRYKTNDELKNEMLKLGKK